MRTSIYGIDQLPTLLGAAGTLRTVTQNISKLRNQLDGSTTVDDYGLATRSVTLNGASASFTSSTIVNADTTNALGWSRTPSQVLAIVYANGTKGTAKGGFFTNGLNGTNTTFTTV